MRNLLEAGKKKFYANLIEKINSKKTLNANERKQYDELAEYFAEKEAPPDLQQSKSIPTTTSQLATLFQVTSATIANWVKIGMPKAAHGRYDLFQAMNWWMETINKGADNEMTTDARDRYWNAKAEEAEIKVAEIKKELMPKLEILGEWGRRIGVVRQTLLSLPIALPPVLEGKDPRTMRDLIRAEAVKILEEYCREGKFCATKKAKKKGAR